MTAPVPNPAPPEPTDPAGATPPATNPKSADDRPLGPAGERALASEREARKALERELASLAPLKTLADALGAGKPEANSKTEIELLNERFASHEKTLIEERAARFRAEVAHEKGLTPAQAARLAGSTREELLADADELLTLFPATGPRTPAPDPSQGARGHSAAVDLAAQIAEANSRGDWRKVAALEKSKLANVKR